MNILVDICHPAHVHFFKNLIVKLQENHNVIIVARNKDVSFKLLDNLGFNYIEIGKHYDFFMGKFFSGLLNIYKFMKICRKNNVNLVLDSGASVYSNVASYFLKIDNISFNNTEVFFLLRLVLFFTSSFITPMNYLLDFGKKHIKIDSFNELAFLHPNLFKANRDIFNKLRIKENQRYALLRFVSWNAAEESKSNELSIIDIRRIVNLISDHITVFISCEYKLPVDLLHYQIEYNNKIKFGDLQDIEANATIFMGESGAMASECAMLGTPSIFISKKKLGFIEDLSENYDLIRVHYSLDTALKEVVSLLKDPYLSKKWMKKRNKMLKNKLDYTGFMVWFVENYPESVKIMKENPSETQKRFL